MPCRNITQLPKPPKTYRVTRAKRRKGRLETKFQAKAETLIRICQLKRTAAVATNRKLARTCRRLADQLWRCWRRGERCGSAACPLCMRRQRKRIAGALWKLVAEDQDLPVTATLLPRGMDYGPGQLTSAVAAKLKAALLSDLNRCEAKEADGYLFAALHGEYEPNQDVFRLHWHLLASGGMKAVVDRLRKRRKYRSGKGDGDVVRRGDQGASAATIKMRIGRRCGGEGRSP